MQSLLALLQLAATLLMSLQNNPNIQTAVAEKSIVAATQIIGLVSQSLADTSHYAQTPSANIWPTSDRLLSSLYVNEKGNQVPLNPNLQLLGNYTSFGDMNGDFADDAITLVRDIPQGDTANATYHLAVMANQGGLLFNIANLDLGKTQPTIYSHEIEAEILTIDMQTGNQARKIYKYKLLGNTLVEI